ncbi:hypothetical protein D3C76_1722790 [compost metagenome]
MGSEGVNALQILCDLLDLVAQMNSQIAGHIHAASPPPTNAAAFTDNAATAAVLSGQLKPITA